MNLKYDMHLSAYKISKETVSEFEELGFQRDEFVNNTFCEVTEYHGTYRGDEALPSDKLWSKLCFILDNDAFFSGGLEEESYNPEETFFFSGRGGDRLKTTKLLPSMKTEQPMAGIHKACDIHININLEESSLQSLKYLEVLRVASFDKPKAGEIHRIFTITCETIEDGRKAFDILKKYFQTIKGLSGRIKLEQTTRFFRKPSTAYTLPLTNKRDFKKWLKEIKIAYVS